MCSVAVAPSSVPAYAGEEGDVVAAVPLNSREAYQRGWCTQTLLSSGQESTLRCLAYSITDISLLIPSW